MGLRRVAVDGLLMNMFSRAKFVRSSMSWTMAVAVMATLAAGVAVAAKPPQPLMSVPQPVRDLYYGDALFYFYQDDFFQSLVHLDAATSL